MPSWNIPALVNKISEDVPALKGLLTALFKWTDNGTTDVPTGAKRLQNIESSGNVVGRQIQEYSGSSWASVGKLMHDADTLDGWHAGQTAQANLVAVRDSNGKLAGDVLGNAATATEASGLASNYVVPIDKGGTNATSAANARTSLGANNASNINAGTLAAAYGGTGRSDGKVEDVYLTDYSTGALSVGQLGSAATKSAVSAGSLVVPGLYFCTGCTTALGYPSTANCFVRTKGSAEISTDVYLVQELSEIGSGKHYRRESSDGGSSWSDWVRDATIQDWSSSNDYAVNMFVTAGDAIYYSKAPSGPSTAAGAKNPALSENRSYWAVIDTFDSVPVGTIIWHSSSTAPAGYLICNGQAVARDTYPDLFNAIGTTYGAGDGSTTFNLPNLIDKFIEGASSNIGDSIAAGLPNITGSFQGRGYANNAYAGVLTTANGSFSFSKGTGSASNVFSGQTATAANDVISFDATRSSSIYGNSSTVQPPAVKLLPCIKAYSSVVNVGELDAAELESYVQNNVVHNTGDEDIYGYKLFYNTPNIIDANLEIHTTTGDITVASGSTVNKYILFKDKNGRVLSAIQEHYYGDGGNSLRFMIRKFNDTSTGISNLTNVGIFAFNAAYFFGPTQENINCGYTGGYRWNQLYAKTSTISTSDERKKTAINGIPDDVLDAWGEVGFVQYQMRDAVEEKGGEARLHSGLIAQRIDEAFKAHGLNASRYALFCHDEWDAKPEERDEQGNVVEEARPAGDEYSLRYEETLCMEAAYQRRRADRAETRIASIEERLAALESRMKG